MVIERTIEIDEVDVGGDLDMVTVQAFASVGEGVVEFGYYRVTSHDVWSLPIETIRKIDWEVASIDWN